MNQVRNTLTKITFVIAIAIAAVACGEQKTENQTISGVVSNAEAGMQLLLWELSATNADIIDSVRIEEDGKFSFNPKPAEKTFYRLTKDNNEGVLIILDSTESVQLNLNSENFASNYTVSGSEDSETLVKLSAIMHRAFTSKDSLQIVYKEMVPNIDEATMTSLQNRMMEIEKTLNKSIKEYIESNINSITVLATIENLDLDKNYDIYKAVDESMGENYPNSQYYKSFHQKFEYSSKFTPGREVPDITLPNRNGELTSLSSLRGKYVLIDFWASWCKPCRAENPNVVKLYNKYKGPNFEIFGVSLDQQKEAWVNAIENDGLDWVHVSDLKLWQSPVVQLYDIKGIPLTILIDPEGKIVAKNLRGDDLANKLNEIFSES